MFVSAMGDKHEDLADSFVYVGHIGGSPVFVGASEELAGFETLSLREFAAIDEAGFALASRARQLWNWRENHRFCGFCGAATGLQPGEHRLQCTSCSRNYYPKLMPCVMALIVDGDRCLLARHIGRSQWWTTLAGFIEAGESVEQTLQREIAEEVGLQPVGFEYYSSQSWPFPGQLMLGFFVRCAPGDIRPDATELEEARWFSRDELPTTPPSYTLSARLIRAFVSGDYTTPRQIQGD